MFFVFEGVDGAGKTTQLTQFVQWLQSKGHDVCTCKDPGSTELGEKLRSILLDNHEMAISMQAEMMLFTTARTQLVQEIIKPALAAGKTVVLDRYFFSSVVYQGHAGNLDPETIRKVNHIATEGLMPDLTLIMDLPVSIAMARLGSSLDRLESRGTEYFEKVREGFHLESESWPTGVELVDANQPIEDIQAVIRKLAQRYLD